MKKLLPLLLTLLAGPAAAQHTELITRAGLGLFRFGGASANPTSHINYGSYGANYTNDPYGAGWGTGFGVGGRVQRVSRGGLLLAFDLGYDWSRSRTSIAVVDLYDGQRNTPYAADGTTHLHVQNLTGFLALGWQLRLAAVRLDVLAGPELAYVFEITDRGNGTYDGGRSWSTAATGPAVHTSDARLRAELTAWVQRVGLNASYSHGSLNYEGDLIGGPVRQVYGRTLRLGLAYRLL